MPPNGTIFQALDAHGISWKNYSSSLPSSLIWSYQAALPGFSSHLVKDSQFFTDAAAGTLPAVSLVDPNFGTSSEEDPQDVQYGDQFLAKVVNAVMASPQWPHTLLVWSYDESGGYYDHVAAAGRRRCPTRGPGARCPATRPGSFDRYGFRVPAGDRLAVRPQGLRVPRGPRPHLGPEADRDQVEPAGPDPPGRRGRRPARQRRPARAQPAFLDPPKLAAPPDPSVLAGCESSGPGHHPAGRRRHHLTAGRPGLRPVPGRGGPGRPRATGRRPEGMLTILVAFTRVVAQP